MKIENRELVLARESPADLLQALEEWRPVRVEKWLDSGNAVKNVTSSAYSGLLASLRMNTLRLLQHFTSSGSEC